MGFFEQEGIGAVRWRLMEVLGTDMERLRKKRNKLNCRKEIALMEKLGKGFSKRTGGRRRRGKSELRKSRQLRFIQPSLDCKGLNVVVVSEYIGGR